MALAVLLVDMALLESLVHVNMLARGRDQIFRKILLKVISSELSSDEEENHRADPYSERQELRESIVLVSGSQQELSLIHI